MLSGELGLLLDSVSESHCNTGLSATTSSSVTGGVSASQGGEGTTSSSGVTLALGEGIMVNRCQSKSSMDGAALALWVDQYGLGGWGM